MHCQNVFMHANLIIITWFLVKFEEKITHAQIIVREKFLAKFITYKIIDIVISSSWIIEFLKCVWSEYRIIFIYLFQPFRLVTVCYPSTPPLWRLWCFNKRPPPTYTFKRHILLFRLNKSCIKWNLTFKVWLKCFINVESIYSLDLWEIWFIRLNSPHEVHQTN